MISDDRCLRPLSILELQNNGPILPPAAEFAKPAAAVPCLAQPAGKALGQEGEHIEDRRFAAAVGSEEYGQGGDVPEFQVAQHSVVLDVQILDARRQCVGIGISRWHWHLASPVPSGAARLPALYRLRVAQRADDTIEFEPMR